MLSGEPGQRYVAEDSSLHGDVEPIGQGVDRVTAGGRPDGDSGAHRREQGEEVRGELVVAVLQHQVSSDGARVAYVSAGHLRISQVS